MQKKGAEEWGISIESPKSGLNKLYDALEKAFIKSTSGNIIKTSL